MKLSRRTFLAGTAAATIAPALPAIAEAAKAPAIYADGIHDDAPGLNALFRGAPVDIRAPEGMIQMHRDRIAIYGGRFRISKPVVFPQHDDPRPVHMHGSHIDHDGTGDDGALFVDGSLFFCEPVEPLAA